MSSMKGLNKQGPRRASGIVALVGACVFLVHLRASIVDFTSFGPLAGSTARKFRRGGVVGSVATAAVATETLQEAAKAKLLDFLDDDAVAQEVLLPEGKPTRGRVDEMIVMLERQNPEKEPAFSELLDGTWKVKYSGSYAPGLLSSPTRELALFLYGGGFSMGNALSSFAQGFWGQSLGLKLGSKTVRIEGGRDVAAKAELVINGQTQTLSYEAELIPLSAQRISEEVMSVDLPPPLGMQNAPFELRRSILITYLDEQVLVVRDESGVAEVLVRQSPFAAPAASTFTSKPAPVEYTGDIGLSEAGEDPMISDAS